MDLDQPIDAAELRWLACFAEIIPAVLDGHGQLLDLGRSRRLFTTTLRRALGLRDGGCALPGCDQPPAACDAHHLVTSWANGGQTSLANGCLLCPRHHRAVHRHGWQGSLDPNGLPQFIPPA